MSSVNGVSTGASSQTSNVQSTQGAQNQNQTSNASESKGSSTEVVADQYAGSVEHVHTGNYNNKGYKVDMDKVNEMKADLKNNLGAFKAMVNGANHGPDGAHGANPLNPFAGIGNDDASWTKWVNDVVSGQYHVSQEQSDEARAAIGEDGYWGVDKTSERIFEFAKTLAGGDMEKFDKMVGAIEKGFGAAKEAWGREMPDITKQTYDRTMERVNAYKEEMGKANTQTQDAVQAAQGAAAV